MGSRYALSNKAPNGVSRHLPLTLTPSEATTYDLESATYKGKYTNEVIVDGTTAVGTVLLPKVADNKGCTMELSHIAGANYTIFKYQTGEQSGAAVFTASATTAGQNATVFCNGETWVVIRKAGTTTV